MHKNTTTMYNKRNKKETVEKTHIGPIHCQLSDTIDILNKTVHRTI